jgi:polyhydroxyalkanoate synthesis regulator phasin
MVLDGLRAYVQLAGGLSDVTRQRALSVARALLEQSSDMGAAVRGPVKDQAAGLAEDLMATSKANRELILSLVSGEVERVSARLGFVSTDELRAVTQRADRLERRVRELELELAKTGGAGNASADTPATDAPLPTPGGRTPTKRPTKPAAKRTATAASAGVDAGSSAQRSSATGAGGPQTAKRKAVAATADSAPGPSEKPGRKPAKKPAKKAGATTHGDALLDGAPALKP